MDYLTSHLLKGIKITLSLEEDEKTGRHKMIVPKNVYQHFLISGVKHLCLIKCKLNKKYLRASMAQAPANENGLVFHDLYCLVKIGLGLSLSGYFPM